MPVWGARSGLILAALAALAGCNCRGGPLVATPAVFSVAPLELNFEEAAVGGSMASRCQGYWERTGLLRAKVLAKGFRARLADALVAQWCLDHQLPLVSRDGDFRHFARWGGLKLVV